MTASNAYKINLQQKADNQSKNTNDNLKETFYCNYSHPTIQKKAVGFDQFRSDGRTDVQGVLCSAARIMGYRLGRPQRYGSVSGFNYGAIEILSRYR